MSVVSFYSWSVRLLSWTYNDLYDSSLVLSILLIQSLSSFDIPPAPRFLIFLVWFELPPIMEAPTLLPVRLSLWFVFSFSLLLTFGVASRSSLSYSVVYDSLMLSKIGGLSVTCIYGVVGNCAAAAPAAGVLEGEEGNVYGYAAWAGSSCS